MVMFQLFMDVTLLEDHHALNNEVDGGSGALRDDEGHHKGGRGGPVPGGEEGVEKRLQADVDQERRCVERHDGQETAGGFLRLEGPAAVDHVGGGGAGDEGDGAGGRYGEAEDQLEQRQQAEVHDRGDTTGDDEPEGLRSQTHPLGRGGTGDGTEGGSLDSGSLFLRHGLHISPAGIKALSAQQLAVDVETFHRCCQIVAVGTLFREHGQGGGAGGGDFGGG